MGPLAALVALPKQGFAQLWLLLRLLLLFLVFVRELLPPLLSLIASSQAFVSCVLSCTAGVALASAAVQRRQRAAAAMGLCYGRRAIPRKALFADVPVTGNGIVGGACVSKRRPGRKPWHTRLPCFWGPPARPSASNEARRKRARARTARFTHPACTVGAGSGCSNLKQSRKRNMERRRHPKRCTRCARRSSWLKLAVRSWCRCRRPYVLQKALASLLQAALRAGEFAA